MSETATDYASAKREDTAQIRPFLSTDDKKNRPARKGYLRYANQRISKELNISTD